MKRDDLKKELRRKYRTIRASLSSEHKNNCSVRVAKFLVEWEFYHKANTILCYSAIQNELSCDKIIETAWNDKKKVCLPKVMDQNRIEIYEINVWNDLEKGAYGILEPIPHAKRKVNPLNIQLVLVPGIAFDVSGYRLGYGGGYYDRFFATYPDLIKVGLTYERFFVSTVYPEPHDQPVDYLVTEDGFYAF